MLSAINLWDPTAAGLSIALALVLAFLLGMIHGVTPDEHTWPITFNYAIGSYSARGGLRAGLLFSAAFTLQRTIASELAYFALADFLKGALWNFSIYIVVGLVMAVSGQYVLKKGHAPHLFAGRHNAGPGTGMPSYMPLVHGFIAGWGTGAFALIVYTVLAPTMGSAYLAFLPGLLFGLGTMVMQMILGALFGAWMARRRLDDTARAFVARMTAGRTLRLAGIAFVLAGIAGLAYPALDDMAFDTGIRIHNLAHLGLGFFMVVLSMVPIAGYAFWRSLREARTLSR